MINVYELRIGCIVEIDGEIRPFEIFDFEYSNFQIANGIPLTPEWLERFGFKLQPLRQSIYIKGRLKIAFGTGAIAYLKHEDNDESYYIGPVNSIHQLQNLYHSLTLKELLITSLSSPESQQATP